MDQNIIKFDDTEIEERKFHHYKSPISINDIYIYNIYIYIHIYIYIYIYIYIICNEIYNEKNI